MMTLAVIALGIVLCCASSLLRADCDYDDFPIMSEMVLHGILADANYNNRPMAVKGFSADTGKQQVIDYYHRTWEEQFDDTVFGPWYQVTTIDDNCMMTVQVAENGDDSSYGRLIISNPPSGDPRAPLGEGLIAPGDAVVVSDLITDDGPKQGRVSILATDESVSNATEYYITRMRQEGWRLQRNFSEAGNAVLVFRRGRDETNILLAPAESFTQILINEVTIK